MDGVHAQARWRDFASLLNCQDAIGACAGMSYITAEGSATTQHATSERQVGDQWHRFRKTQDALFSGYGSVSMARTGTAVNTLLRLRA